MKGLSRWTSAIVAVGVALLASCTKTAPPAVPAGECPPLPANVVLTEAELKLASAQLGELSVGGLEFDAKPELVEIVSKGATGSQVVMHLVCEALRRGELSKDDTARVDYLREGLLFMTRDPTPAQVLEYQKQHRPPPPRTGKLEIPQMHEEQGKLVLEIQSVPPIQSFRVINSGDAKIQFWFAQVPSERLYITLEDGPVNLAAGEFIEAKMVLVQFAGEAEAEVAIELRTAQPASAREILVRVPNMAKVAAAYQELAGEIMKDLVTATKSDPAFASLGPGGADTDALTAKLVAGVAQRTVNKRWPELSGADSTIVTGTLLEASSWPQAAASLYRTASENNVLEGPLLARSIARAEFFAQASNEGSAEKQASWVEYVSNQGRTDGTALLELGSLNPLVAEQNIPEAKATVQAFKGIEALSVYRQTLQADLALSRGNVDEALKLYSVCQSTFMRTCTLRKAEAQIRNHDVGAAKRTIESLNKSTSAADTFVYDRAIKQLGRDDTG